MYEELLHHTKRPTVLILPEDKTEMGFGYTWPCARVGSVCVTVCFRRQGMGEGQIPLEAATIYTSKGCLTRLYMRSTNT